MSDSTNTSSEPAAPETDPAAPEFPRYPQEDAHRNRPAIRAAVERVLTSPSFILGPEVRAFEREFAAYVDSANGVGVASGTDAIELALRALGVGNGDRVATVSHTASATVSAILRLGANPVFVDVDAATFVMDPRSLEACLDAHPGIRAVVPVHLYGQMAPMEEISALARARSCAVVEDAAQCHGARGQGAAPGRHGDAVAWSFYPTKNLGAVGDGGMVTTRDADTAERLRALREYGWGATRFVSEQAGVNSRLDELQAAVLRVKLEGLDEANRRRSGFADRYRERLAGTGVTLPETAAGNLHAWHLFVVRISGRDRVLGALHSRGIPAAVHYPVPLHRQPLLAAAHAGSGLPVTDQLADEILTLPLHPWLEQHHIDLACDALLDLLA